MQSDAALITSLRIALGKRRKGDGGLGSQRRVATALGIAESYVSDVVNGRRKLSKAVRAKLERRLAQ